MSTPDNHGKKAPQFAAFKPLTTVQNTNDCCCDGACSSTPTLSENVSGTRYSWKVSGMDCAACARKVENAVALSCIITGLGFSVNSNFPFETYVYVCIVFPHHLQNNIKLLILLDYLHHDKVQ